MIFAKKSLGQNFLVDQNIIKKIVNSVKVTNKNVLEIGPGKGALTNEILKKNPKSLTLVEKDYKIYENLKEKYKKNKKIEVKNNDILNFDLEKKLKKNSIIFGNLPYNISSQILVKIIRFKIWPPNFTDVIFMFQKEMADRIIGKFDSSGYGRLSILTNYRFDVLKKFNVSPNCFLPKPKVNSTVIFLKPKKMNKHKIENIGNLEMITRIFFSNRRKMINKPLSKIFKNHVSVAEKLKIKLHLRPSELSNDDYYKLTEYYEKVN